MNEPVQQPASKEFGRKMGEVLNHGGLALMLSLGHRTGLLDSMSKNPPGTSAEIAKAAGLSERYVREWLGAMTAGGVVEYRTSDGTYRLPPEHAEWLTRAAGPQNIAAAMQWVAVLGYVEDQVADAFRHGKGVPYSAYHRFHELMAETSSNSVVKALNDQILPLVSGLVERLEKGVDVLDVGCGAGGAINEMAARFPKSRFAGYDASPEAIAAARAEAELRGLKNARFETKDVADLSDAAAFDLVTAFDAIHDQAKPDAVLRNVAKALKPGGTFLMQDISGSSHIEADVSHPFGTYLYTVSCMHCMSVSLANGGPGLGAMWGKDLALKMLKEAGFGPVRVETLPHDPMNYFYVTSPAGAVA